ncbi:hypothetical protein EDB80DRAFT_215295 [Ilyonectria destructans]|nr:hypothetical protein EDB80DRAFT_215295 [Ilyonectria destructans]
MHVAGFCKSAYKDAAAMSLCRLLVLVFQLQGLSLANGNHIAPSKSHAARTRRLVLQGPASIRLALSITPPPCRWSTAATHLTARPSPMPPDVQAVSRQSSSSPPSVHRPAAVSLVQTKPRLPICNLPNSALKSNSALHGHCWSTPAKPDALPRASSAWASPSGRRGPTGAGRSHTIQIQGRVPLMLMACPLCSDR